MNLLKALVFACILVNVYAILPCNPPENPCENAKCDKSITLESCTAKGPNYIFKPDGGYCKCCALCEQQLAVNEPCVPIEREDPPTKVCGKGLKCDYDANKCVQDA